MFLINILLGVHNRQWLPASRIFPPWSTATHFSGWASQGPLCACLCTQKSFLQNCLPNLSILNFQKSAPLWSLGSCGIKSENECYTPGGSFPQRLCRCLVLHSVNEGIAPLLMLVPSPGMTFTCMSTYWNPNHITHSVSNAIFFGNVLPVSLNIIF